MNKTGKILAAVAAGAAVGAILGVLFAPDKGSETRRKINEQGKKFAGDLRERFREGKAKFDDLKENLKQTMNEDSEELA
jgi:gas vesicle protein